VQHADADVESQSQSHQSQSQKVDKAIELDTGFNYFWASIDSTNSILEGY
jgi:hypothetical protein